VQGPLSASVLQHLTKDDLSKLYFGEFRITDINGAYCFITRTGYASFWLLLHMSSFLKYGMRIYDHLYVVIKSLSIAVLLTFHFECVLNFPSIFSIFQ
jgi:hypothetical protein